MSSLLKNPVLRDVAILLLEWLQFAANKNELETTFRALLQVPRFREHCWNLAEDGSPAMIYFLLENNLVELACELLQDFCNSHRNQQVVIAFSIGDLAHLRLWAQVKQRVGGILQVEIPWRNWRRHCPLEVKNWFFDMQRGASATSSLTEWCNLALQLDFAVTMWSSGETRLDCDSYTFFALVLYNADPRFAYDALCGADFIVDRDSILLAQHPATSLAKCYDCKTVHTLAHCQGIFGVENKNKNDCDYDSDDEHDWGRHDCGDAKNTASLADWYLVHTLARSFEVFVNVFVTVVGKKAKLPVYVIIQIAGYVLPLFDTCLDQKQRVEIVQKCIDGL